MELSSAIGTDLYFDYCIREKRTYIDILEDFPTALPPLERLLEMIPILSPRLYSIASSAKKYPDEVSSIG